jgi:hypothetical protein
MDGEFVFAATEFFHGNRVVYEWEQSMEEVHIYIPIPPGARKNAFDIKIQAKRLRIGLKENPPYLDHELSKLAVTAESFWTISDGMELDIHLQKAAPGEVWEAAFEGHAQIDPVKKDRIAQELVRERFAAEHPGFDFSQAEFQGAAPNPRTFMKF